MRLTARLSAVVFAGFILCCPLLRAQHRPSGPDPDERLLLDAANRERAERHIPPLRWDDHLARAARHHALMMASMGAISHQFPGEPDLTSRLNDAGLHFTFAAENVALAESPSEIQDAWMRSPGHRENILDKRGEFVGIAAVRHGVHVYAVEDFARLLPQLTFEQQEQEVGSLLAALGLHLRRTTDDVRETCALPHGVPPGVRPRYLFRYVTQDIGRLPEELSREINRGSFQSAAVGACEGPMQEGFFSYRLAVLLY